MREWIDQRTAIKGYIAALLMVCVSTGATAEMTAPGYQFVQNLQAELDGLEGAFDIVADSTGTDLYASGFLNNAVVHFKRDAQTGALSWYGTYRHGEQGISALIGPKQMALSEDGTTLYVAVSGSDGVIAFLRDPLTGGLTWQTEFLDATLLDGASAVALNPAGDRVYVGSFLGGGIQVLARNPPAVASPLYSVVDSDLVGTLSIVPVEQPGAGTVLYVASSLADTLSVWLDTGAQILPVQSFTDGMGGMDGLDGASDIAISDDGRHLYVSSLDDSTVTLFNRNSQGLLTFGSAFDGGWILSGVARIDLSADGLHLYSTSSANDQLVVLDRDPVTGIVDFQPPVRGGVQETWLGMDNPYGLLIVSPHVYVTGLQSDSVVVFAEPPFLYGSIPIGGQLQKTLDANTGGIADVRPKLARLRQVVGGGQPGEPYRYQRFFAAQNSPHGGVVSLLSDKATGQLLVDWVLPALVPAETVVLTSGNGLFLYVGYDFDTGNVGTLNVYAIGNPGEPPVPVQTGIASRGSLMTGIRAMAWGSDEEFLYVVSPNGVLASFASDPITKELTFEEARLPAGWDELVDLAISPSGDALFATARNTDGVVRWEIDDQGALSPTSTYVGSGSQYAAPRSIEVSGDGSRLYVTTVFGWHLLNVPIVGSALGAAQDIVLPAISASLVEGPGRRIYIALGEYDAVKVFQQTGAGALSELGYLDADFCSPQSPGPCLENALGVAIGANGKTILVTGGGAEVGNPTGGVVVLTDQNPLFIDDFETGEVFRWSTSSLPL